jgi:hypothetical protein
VPIENARTDSDGKAVHGDCYVHEINDHNGHVKEEKRSWSAIAKELSQEQDLHRVGELANELNKALARSGRGGTSPFNPKETIWVRLTVRCPAVNNPFSIATQGSRLLNRIV